TANGIEVSTELTRRYSNTTITVQNKTNGAVGMFVLNVKRKETTDTKKPVIAVPMVAVGDDFSIALRSDGSVWSWGRNDKGQLGVGTAVTATDRPVPVMVSKDGETIRLSDVTNIIYVAAGQYHAVAIDEDHNVWTWGYNGFGQIGNGTMNYYEQVMTSHHDYYYWGYSCCASPDSNAGNQWLTADHYHYAYQRVDNDAYLPVKVTGYGWDNYDETDLTKDYVVSVSAGDNHTVALTRNGNVYAWGDNRYNQIAMPQSYEQGGYMGHYRQYLNYARDNGRDLTRVPVALNPVRVAGVNGAGYLEHIIDIKAGGEFTVALRMDGSVYTWGRSDEGQLGDGYAQTHTEAYLQTGNGGYAIKKEYRRIGNHSQIYNKYYPVQVKAGVQTVTASDNTTWESKAQNAMSYAYNYLQEVTTISAGRAHAAVIGLDGKVFTWGDNTYGSLGNSESGMETTGGVTTFNKVHETVPVRTVIKSFETDEEIRAVQITSGSNQTFAVTTQEIVDDWTDPSNTVTYTEPDVWTWGDNTTPQHVVITYPNDWEDGRVGGSTYREPTEQLYRPSVSVVDNNTTVTGQLGLGVNTQNMRVVDEPTQVEAGNTVNANPELFSEHMRKYGNIATRGNHTVMYNTQYGTVWSWGTGSDGVTTHDPWGPRSVATAATNGYSVGRNGDYTDNVRLTAVQVGATDYIRP
ncbi:MAG: hypothetical protein IJP94_00745, partial [Clostridia bacterium]|nr:hypothetical protein [Clostridia bacterium]